MDNDARQELEAEKADHAVTRTQLETATSQRDQARRELREAQRCSAEIEQRIADIADESFGPLPVQDVTENLTTIERGLFDWRMKFDQVRAAVRRLVERATAARDNPTTPLTAMGPVYVLSALRIIDESLAGPPPSEVEPPPGDLVRLVRAWANHDAVDEKGPRTTPAEAELLYWIMRHDKDPRVALLPPPEQLGAADLAEAERRAERLDFCKLFPACQHTPGPSGYCACHEREREGVRAAVAAAGPRARAFQAKPTPEVLNRPLDAAPPPRPAGMSTVVATAQAIQVMTAAPPGHVTTAAGDCVPWCAGCRWRDDRGLPRDAAPSPVDRPTVRDSVQPVVPDAPPVDRGAITTLKGTPVDELRVQQAAQPTGQHADYIVLTDEERAKGFVRPVRRSYVHRGAPPPPYPMRDLTPEEHERFKAYGYVKYMEYPADAPERARGGEGRFYTQADLDRVGTGCNAKTTMGQKLAETYARDPKFYGATFCCSCDRHFPVGADGEFVWDGTNERVGT